jgi:hypothetical protein
VAGYCSCSTPKPEWAEGVRYCATCGCQVPDPRDRLLALIAKQQAGILERLEALEDSPARGNGRLLAPAELATLLGRSPQWIREHADELRGVRVGDGPRPRYFFDAERARDALAALSNGDRKPSPPKKSSPARRRRSKSGPDLLPVKGRTAA